jgi:predicted nucleic acid-binding Zn finger protein
VNSSMIGKIEKAHRYAKEPERVRVRSFESTFHGSHDDYQVRLVDGRWFCSCHAFTSHAVGTCAHVMALQQLLSPMLSAEDRFGSGDLPVGPEALSLAN